MPLKLYHGVNGNNSREQQSLKEEEQCFLPALKDWVSALSIG
jgi:hypothetical protein